MKAFAHHSDPRVRAQWSVSIGEELKEADVKALETKCETAREARLKPLRDAEIAQCKSKEKRNDPDYCDRYYRDLGDASRRRRWHLDTASLRRSARMRGRIRGASGTRQIVTFD